MNARLLLPVLAAISLTLPAAAVEPDINAASHVRGNAAAKHTLVEYSDFQCPYCSRGAAVVEQLRKKYGKDLRVVFKNMPLEKIHPNAMPAARFLEAAFLQSPEKGWEFYDRLFANQDKLGEEFYLQTGKSLRLDNVRLQSDAASLPVKLRIDNDIAEFKALGFTGTPSFSLDGIKIGGAYPAETFVKAIDWLELGGSPEKFTIPGQAVAKRPAGPLKPDLEGAAHVRGEANAKYTLVEYLGFQDPFSQRVAGMIGDLRQRYGRDLRVVYKNVPMPVTMHPQSLPAARYFEAAALQSPEKALQFHDRLFADPSRLGEAFYKETARDLGLDVKRLEADAAGDAVARRIKTDMEEFTRLGFQGTPAFVLNGIGINGAYPVEVFAAAIKSLDEGGRPEDFDAVKTYAAITARAAAPAAQAQAPAPAAPVSAGIDRAEMQRMMEQAATKAVIAQAAAAQAAKPAAIQSDADRPAYERPSDADKIAVVIGIEKYAGLPEARFARRDAQAVRDHLIALGYPSRNIMFLADQEATKGSVLKAVNSWLPNRVTEKSTVFFYYSGHGAPDPKSSLAYLVPIDGDPEDLEDTAYPLKQLYQKLNALKAKRVIVALDSCFSGAGGRSVLAKDTRPLVTKVETGVLSAGKVVTLSASKNDQVSGAIEEQGHGTFTYYLLKGLNGGAQGADGHVTVKALYDYLTPRVEDAARLHNRDQEPQLMGDSAALSLR